MSVAQCFSSCDLSDSEKCCATCPMKLVSWSIKKQYSFSCWFISRRSLASNRGSLARVSEWHRVIAGSGLSWDTWSASRLGGTENRVLLRGPGGGDCGEGGGEGFRGRGGGVNGLVNGVNGLGGGVSE